MPIFRTCAIRANDDSAQNAMIEYFDKNHTMVSDEKKFKFRNVIPVNRYGDVRADILYQEKRGGEWKTVKTFPFQKDEIWVLPDIRCRLTLKAGNYTSRKPYRPPFPKPSKYILS